jgi:hypothetical protein
VKIGLANCFTKLVNKTIHCFPRPSEIMTWAGAVASQHPC